MNKVDEILIKYEFIKETAENSNLDEMSQQLNKSIGGFIDKSNEQYRNIKHREVNMINNILDIGTKSVANRIDYKLNDLLNDELYIGKSFSKLETIKEILSSSVESQSKLEEKLISSIKIDLGTSMFKELEHELLSDEFLEYIME